MKTAYKTKLDLLFEKNKGLAGQRNASVLKIVLVGAIFGFAFLTLGSLFIEIYVKTFPLNLICLLCCGALLATLSRAKDGTRLFHVYATHGVMLAYSVLVSICRFPSGLGAIAFGIALLTPVLYLDKNWRITLITGVSAVIYLSTAIFLNDLAPMSGELFIIVIFGALSCIIGAFNRRSLLTNYDMEQSLRMSDEQCRLVLAQSGNIMCRYTVADRSITTTPEVAAVFSMPETMRDLPYAQIKLGVVSPESTEAFIEFYENIHRGRKTGTASFCIKTTIGWRWLKGSFSTVFSDKNEPAYAVVTFSDITEQRKREFAYEKWQQEVESMSQSKMTIFEWNLTHDVSEGESGDLINGFKDLPMTTFNDRSMVYAANHVHEIDRERYILMVNRERLLDAHSSGITSSEIDYRELVAGDRCHWMHLTIQTVSYTNSCEVKAYLLYKNVDKEKRASITIETKASRDPLTKLLNRGAFQDEVMKLLSTEQLGPRHAFVIIDIDNFKMVNDVFGHMTGDGLLAETSGRLRSMLRRDDIVARLGGDEFIVCMRDVTSHETTENRIESIRRSLYQELSPEVTVSASIGVASYPKDGLNFGALYQKADIALYEAKRRGKNRYVFYDEAMEGSSHTASPTPIDELIDDPANTVV